MKYSEIIKMNSMINAMITEKDYVTELHNKMIGKIADLYNLIGNDKIIDKEEIKCLEEAINVLEIYINRTFTVKIGKIKNDIINTYGTAENK